MKLGAIEVTQPFPFEALPRIWKWIASFRGKVADDFSPQTEDEFVCYMASRWKDQKTWAVYAAGELGGLVTFERLSGWRGTAHIVLKPDFQGRGIAVQACRTAVAEMFQIEGLGKLEFTVLAGNLAIGSLLVNIGAAREGTRKDHTQRGGKPADVWEYGLTKIAFLSTLGIPNEVLEVTTK